MRVDFLAETVRWLSLTERPGETAETLRSRTAMFPNRAPGPSIVPGDGEASTARPLMHDGGSRVGLMHRTALLMMVAMSTGKVAFGLPSGPMGYGNQTEIHAHAPTPDF